MPEQKPVVVGIGEALWDVFPDRAVPGGSPCNVAYQATMLGNRGVIATRLGTDAYGRDLHDFLTKHGVDTSVVQTDPVHPTGTVQVEIEDGEPSYTITENVAWDHLVFDDALRDLAARTDAVCFATLAQRSPTTRETIHRFLAALPPRTLRVFDVNLRPPFYSEEVLLASIRHADVIKMNRDEYREIERLTGQSDVLEWLFQEHGVRLICLTKGHEGAELIMPDTRVSRPAEPVDTSEGDAVGVGDAFLAATTHALIHAMPLADTLDFANRHAARIATRKGGMPLPPLS